MPDGGSPPGVMSSCCGAYVTCFILRGVKWWECTDCGEVLKS